MKTIKYKILRYINKHYYSDWNMLRDFKVLMIDIDNNSFVSITLRLLAFWISIMILLSCSPNKQVTIDVIDTEQYIIKGDTLYIIQEEKTDELW